MKNSGGGAPLMMTRGDVAERCQVCGAVLHFGTDGNGEVVPECRRCDHLRARNALKPTAERLGCDTNDRGDTIERATADLYAAMEQSGALDVDVDGLGVAIPEYGV
jgi:hypothetical protein